MNCPNEMLEDLDGMIKNLDEPVASQMGEMLNKVREYIDQGNEESRRLGEAQADAIVHSAEIITELEETKERLEKVRLLAEASADEARSLSAFGDILEHSNNEIYIFDCETLKFDHVNRGARKNIGYSIEELSCLTPLDIKPDFSREKFLKLIAPLRKDLSENIEFNTLHRRKDGSTYPVELQIEKSVFHNRPVYVAIVRDISYRLEMESKNSKLQKDLIVASRKAGMAEVATGVLHNVGNILNSVNISTNLIRKRFSKSALDNLEKVSSLILDNESKFAEFVRDDNRGQKLPNYISKVTDTLCHEREKINQEFDDLAKNVEHIKEIVAVQQSMARSSGMSQKLIVGDLIDDVMAATKGTLANHRVELTMDFDDSNFEFTSDKHKVLQILINLVWNAKDAVLESNNTVRKICLRVKADGEDVVFQVSDNGVGIPDDKLVKIFQHGFTTKKTGHGFGLHCSANAATELGGSLSVSSDGIGSGATFELRIPQAMSCVSSIN